MELDCAPARTARASDSSGRRRLALVLATTLAASVLVVGSSTPAGSRPRGARSADPGITKNEIVIGRPTTLSGAGANLARNTVPVTQAYLDEVNEDGGVNGRKLTQAIEDAGSLEPTSALAAVTKLKDQAFVMAASDGSIFGPLAQRFKMPFFYGFGTEAESLNNKYAFPIGAYTEYQARKLFPDFLLKKLGAKNKTIAVVYEQTGYLGASNTAFLEAAKKKGLNIVIDQPVDGNAPTCNQEVANVKAKNPDIVVPIVLRGALCLFREANAQGVKTTWTGLSPTWLVGTFIALGGPGYLDGSQVLNIYNTFDSKCGQEYQALVKERLPDRPDALTDEIAFYSYLAIHNIVAHLEKAGKKLTRESFIKTVSKEKNFDDGCLAPASYGPGNKRQGPVSVQVATIENGKPVTKDPTWHKKF